MVLPLATLDAMWHKAEEYLQSSNSVVPAPGEDSKAKMVTSRSKNPPHFVQVVSSGHYICDNNCIQWSSSDICSHILVSAELNNELNMFLQWYVRNGKQPNITNLARSGLPAGRGRKGGAPKRKRSKSVQGEPDVVVQREAVTYDALHQPVSLRQPVTLSPSRFCVSQTISASGQNEQIINCGYYSPNISSFEQFPMYNYFPMSPVNPHLQGQGKQIVSNSPVVPVPPNNNPFFVRFIEGNIRMCQGCRSSLRYSNGLVPLPPFNLCIGRAEQRSYRDSAGVLRTPQKMQNVYYHLSIACVKSVCTNFSPSSLQIPSDVLKMLLPAHKEILFQGFGIELH